MLLNIRTCVTVRLSFADISLISPARCDLLFCSQMCKAPIRAFSRTSTVTFVSFSCVSDYFELSPLPAYTLCEWALMPWLYLRRCWKLAAEPPWRIVSPPAFTDKNNLLSAKPFVNSNSAHRCSLQRTAWSYSNRTVQRPQNSATRVPAMFLNSWMCVNGQPPMRMLPVYRLTIVKRYSQHRTNSGWRGFKLTLWTERKQCCKTASSESTTNDGNYLHLIIASLTYNSGIPRINTHNRLAAHYGYSVLGSTYTLHTAVLMLGRGKPL